MSVSFPFGRTFGPVTGCEAEVNEAVWDQGGWFAAASGMGFNANA